MSTAIHSRRWRERHPDHVIVRKPLTDEQKARRAERGRKWRATHKRHIREQHELHKVKRNAQRRARYKLIRERAIAYHKRWKALNRDRVRAYDNTVRKAKRPIYRMRAAWRRWVKVCAASRMSTTV